MANKKLKERWTIINIEEDVKNTIVEYANENGYTIARSIKELTKKDLKKWKKRKEEQ